MGETVFVSTKAELKKALEDKAQEILITDLALANYVMVVMSASKVAIGAAVAGMGIASFNMWNPHWLGVAGLTAATSATLVAAIVALGISAILIWVLWNDYDFVLRGENIQTLQVEA